MNLGFSARSKVLLSIVVLLCVDLLIQSKGRIRNRRDQTVGGLLGLLGVALEVYRHTHFGFLLSLSLVNIFFFGHGLVDGAAAGMLISFLRPTSAKNVLRVKRRIDRWI